MQLLRLACIDGHDLLRQLDAIQGQISIQILVELPAEAGHPTDSFSIHGDYGSVPRFRLMIEALAAMGDLDLQLFTLVLSEYEPAGTAIIFEEGSEEIEFSVSELKGWSAKSVREKQQFLLETVSSRLDLNRKALAQKLDIPPSHLSNVMGGKSNRKLGWRPMMNLLKRFRWSLKSRELIREVMQTGKASKK